MNEFTLYTLTYLLSQALGIYSVYKLIKSFFDGCKIKNSVEAMLYMLYYALTATVYLTINIPLINLIVNIIAIFLLTFLYQSSIKKKLLVWIINIYIFMFGTEMIVVTLTGYIDFPIAERNDYHSVFGIVMVNVLIYAVSMAANGFKNIKIGNTLPETYWISLFLVPISSLFMLLMIFQSVGLSMYQITISIIAVLIINFTVFFLFDRVARLYQDKQEKGLIEQQNKYYENQLQIINETQEVSNILKHDMKNHLRSLFSDIKSGKLSPVTFSLSLWQHSALNKSTIPRTSPLIFSSSVKSIIKSSFQKYLTGSPLCDIMDFTEGNFCLDDKSLFCLVDGQRFIFVLIQNGAFQFLYVLFELLFLNYGWRPHLTFQAFHCPI